MNNSKLELSTLLISISTIAYGIFFMIGHKIGQNTKKEELEQKLCQLKQYEYCTKEELLKNNKIIKKDNG